MMQEHLDRLEGLVAAAVAKQEAASQPSSEISSKDPSSEWNDGMPRSSLAREDNALVANQNDTGLLIFADVHSRYKGETPWDDVLSEVPLFSCAPK
jgi:hypothetical protein